MIRVELGTWADSAVSKETPAGFYEDVINLRPAGARIAVAGLSAALRPLEPSPSD